MATEKQNNLQVKEPFRFDVSNFYPLFSYSCKSPSHAFWNAPLSNHTHPYRTSLVTFLRRDRKHKLTSVLMLIPRYICICRNVREFRVIHMAGTSPTRRLCSGLLIECYLKGVYPLQASHFTDSSFFHQALSSLKVVSLGRQRRCNFLSPLSSAATESNNRPGNGQRGSQSIHRAAAL